MLSSGVAEMVWGSAARILRSLVSSAGPYQGSEGSLRALRVIFLHPTRARVLTRRHPHYLSIHQPATARVSLRDSGEKLRIPQSEQAPTGCCGDHRPFHMPVPRIARAPTYQKGSDAYPHRGGRALTRRGDAQQEIRDRAALALCFVQKGLHAGVAALLNQACPCGSSSMRSRPTVSGTRTKKPRGRMKAKTGHG